MPCITQMNYLLLLHVKLASANSVFAENFRYLCFKYQITREDCNKQHSFLVGKVKFKTPLHVQSTCQTIAIAVTV